MSTLEYWEKRKLENLLGMSSGYVLRYTDRSFGDLFYDVAGVEIHSQKYQARGTSKANKLRGFWELEPDHVVGKVLLEIIREYRDRYDRDSSSEDVNLLEECQSIVERLISGHPSLDALAETASKFDAEYLQKEIARIESAIDSDPDLAIGTSKELIETCCRTILKERGVTLKNNADVSELTRATFKQLKLTRDDVPDAIKGTKSIQTVLSNLGSIANEIARLRNLYGTGHGKDGDAVGLSPRHARLVVGASATLVQFMLESHISQKGVPDSPIEFGTFRF